MERLTELRGACYHIKGLDVDNLQELSNQSLICKATDALAAYESAEEEGRLVILPCKFKSTLYWVGIYRGKLRIVQYRVEDVTVFKTGYFISCGKTLQFFNSDIGKTVFFTREEAEEALGAAHD